jgi:hypothetical protein
MSKEMSKEEALKVFKDLLESEDIVEVEVRKIYVDENNAYRGQLVIRVVLKE